MEEVWLVSDDSKFVAERDISYSQLVNQFGYSVLVVDKAVASILRRIFTLNSRGSGLSAQ